MKIKYSDVTIEIPIYDLDKFDYLDKNEIWKLEQRATGSTFEPNKKFMKDLSLRVSSKKMKAIELLSGIKFTINQPDAYEIEYDGEVV